MAAPGVRNMGLGALLVVAGLVASGAMSGAREGSAIIAIGALGIGVLKVLWGLGQFVSRARSALDKVLPGTSDATKALVRSAVYAAESDGPLDDRKIAGVQAALSGLDLDADQTHTTDVSPEMHAAIANKTHSVQYPKDKLRQIAALMRADKQTTLDYLSRVSSGFTPPVKRLIVRTSAIILTQNGRFEETQSGVLSGIAKALEISDQDFDAATAGLSLHSSPTPVYSKFPSSGLPQNLQVSYGEQKDR